MFMTKYFVFVNIQIFLMTCELILLNNSFAMLMLSHIRSFDPNTILSPVSLCSPC